MSKIQVPFSINVFIVINMVNKLFRIIFLSMLVTSCSNADEHIVYHPTDKNFLDAENIASVIYTDNDEKSDFVKDFLKRIEEKTLVTQLGVLDGDSNQVFSDITQVMIEDERIIIFDRNNTKISIFDLEANHIQSFGHYGQGPSDLQYPSGITKHDDLLYISDRMQSVKKVTIHEALGEGSVEIDFFLSDLDGMPEGICTLGHSIIIQYQPINYEAGKHHNSFHQFDLVTGQKVNSFGASYFIDQDFMPVGEMLSEGIFACMNNGSHIAQAMYIVPYIYFYNSQGTVEWVVEIDDYIPFRYQEEKGVRIYPVLNEKFHYFNTIVSVEEYVLVQVKEFRGYIGENERMQSEEVALRTYLIDKTNGDGMYLGSDLLEIAYIDSDYIVFNSSKNYPSIKIYEI